LIGLLRGARDDALNASKLRTVVAPRPAVKQLLFFARRTRNPLRNRVIVLLFEKAGLRAGEIAALTWEMVLDPRGQVGKIIELRDCAAKKSGDRLNAMHADLRTALVAWRKAASDMSFVARSERGGQMTPLSVVVWFSRAFQQIGLQGCSSHSGRRTFITRAARLVHRAAARRTACCGPSIQTTQGYIDGNSDAQRKLVALI
jgi:integrase